MIEDDYERLSKVGEGTYGVVYKAKDKKTGQVVALKKIRFDEEDEGIPSTALREVSMLKELKDSSIVQLLDHVFSGDHMYLVFEFVDVDLKRYIETSPEQITPHQVSSIMHQLFQGITYCHSRAILHRDLKPQNILINAKGEAKLADFGLARTVSLPLCTHTHEVVTLWYRAPEVLLGASLYGPELDIWSLGCIFAELANKEPLMMGDTEIHQIYLIFQLLGTPTPEDFPQSKLMPDYNFEAFPKWKKKPLKEVVPSLDDDGIDLLGRCLQLASNDRIPAIRAIRHPYFKNRF
ncbi:kinase-like domain-containing protein [Piptocephalis cylindrospora]|uniref:Cyclin-dependent kinase 1 n=1 Tax=Piptocephalis cylindrospora TaxID=1907219 RepID=A0A4P9Y8N2_9FUNG|nr:kinase-like domain-containing protein [Piptocephalis cylindrospora]|eukprot:RKP15385.1 kinase-like domain-containing protein [Piptocephalis cylindrospora]